MRLIGGVREVVQEYDGFLLDLWGLTHNGITPFVGVVDCLRHLRHAGKRICFLSNSPHRIKRIAQDLSAMGITPDLYDGIVSSGEEVFVLLEQSLDFGRVCFDFWAGSDSSTLEGLEDKITRTHTLEKADFLLGSLIDTGRANYLSDYMSILDAARARDLPFVCANPDLSVIHGDRIHLCPGTLAQAYESMGGRVVMVGKPYGLVYDSATRLLDVPQERILAAGDSLRTDIQGAGGYGLDSLLALTGLEGADLRDYLAKHRRRKRGSHTTTAEYRAQEHVLEGLAHITQEATHKPSMVIHSFVW